VSTNARIRASGTSARAPVRRAVRDALPIALSLVPMGALVGFAMDGAGATGPAALAITAFLHSAAAPLAALEVLGGGGGLLAALVVGAVVNLRLVLFSASLGPRFRDGHPWWFRWIAPGVTGDVHVAMAANARDLGGEAFRRYWTTIAAVIASAWVVATGVGLRLTAVVPTVSPLQAVVPATFVALLVPQMAVPRMRWAIVTAATVAVVGASLPSGLDIVAAILAGVAVAGPDRGGAR
jgi:predicted branched-subunit amino acid permease